MGACASRGRTKIEPNGQPSRQRSLVCCCIPLRTHHKKTGKRSKKNKERGERSKTSLSSSSHNRGRSPKAFLGLSRASHGFEALPLCDCDDGASYHASHVGGDEDESALPLVRAGGRERSGGGRTARDSNKAALLPDTYYAALERHRQEALSTPSEPLHVPEAAAELPAPLADGAGAVVAETEPEAVEEADAASDAATALAADAVVAACVAAVPEACVAAPAQACVLGGHESIAEEGEGGALACPPRTLTTPEGHWDVQLQVASGIGKYHAAMAAAKEKLAMSTMNVGRIGEKVGRKPRRAVYETDLE